MPKRSDLKKNIEERNRLIVDNRGLAYRVVDSLGVRRSTPLYEDCVQAALEALCKAADRYDATQGAKFATFAWPALHGAALDQLSRRAVVHTPTKVVTARATAGKRSHAPELSTSKFDAPAHAHEDTCVPPLPAALIDDTAVEHLEQRAEREALYAAINLLSEPEQDALYWHLSSREPTQKAYCERSGLAKSTVQERMKNALEALKALLSPPTDFPLVPNHSKTNNK